MRHQELTNETGMSVYFADPYRSGQRGTNENTNGLLRRYLPKKTSFRGLSQGELNDIVAGMICVYTDDDHGFGNRYKVEILEPSVPTGIITEVLEVRSPEDLRPVGEKIVLHHSLLEPTEEDPEFDEEPTMFD